KAQNTLLALKKFTETSATAMRDNKEIIIKSADLAPGDIIFLQEGEKDFFEGVKFLHMSIQFLRNEKAHTPAQDLDKNLAIHYISLASLAYDLITRK
ncbi:MAG: TIGR02391 family protein, partial [Elusimicrobiota bacterium]